MSAEIGNYTVDRARSDLDLLVAYRQEGERRGIPDAIERMHKGRGWLLLGFESWDAMCKEKLGGLRVWGSVDERREIVAELADAGLSSRAIGAALGISKSQVNDDRSPGVQNRTPGDGAAPVDGLDGKTYTRKKLTAKESAAINDRIRELLAQGMTQAAAGKEIGLSFGAISQRVIKYNLDGRHGTDEDSTPKQQSPEERVAELAAAGYDSRQIAQDMGFGREYIRRVANKAGITITADRIKGNSRVVELNTAMDRGVENVEMALHPFLFIDFDQLDPERAQEWSRSLNQSAKELRTLIRRINQLMKERDQHGAV